MFRSRSWFGGGWNKPKNRLSLDHLKYLHSVLEKNTTVSENNRGLLVESLRSIAEILIWGDQNDSSVFDFFLEKNMLSYFLHIMRQKSGGSSFVCVQLLQTLNILFENIRNETSLYYLLSNNHVNSIIVHKFDYSDEDVMGYYILFLKTLSLKLNTHTIHFFYNEHTNDFPLYTEAIKFFNHPESMVRIAVRTITLNVYRVPNSSMLQFIRDRTAAPYFTNLVWFIGKHILELDSCVRNDADHHSTHRLSNLVAEHLDHLHYLNDILCLDIPDLNAVLTEHLLHKLFVPLYMFSLTPSQSISMAEVTRNLAAVLNKKVDIDIGDINNPRVSSVVSLFLLSLVFLVITHGPLVFALAWVILNGDHSVFKEGAIEVLHANLNLEKREMVTLGFGQPHESLEESLESTIMSSSSSVSGNSDNHHSDIAGSSSNLNNQDNLSSTSRRISDELPQVNITDDEKARLRKSFIITKESSRPFLDMVLSALDCTENDYLALLSLCLIYAITHNKGVDSEWLDLVLCKSTTGSIKYKTILLEKLLQIINLSSQPSCRVRLVTLELALKLYAYLLNNNSSGESAAVTEIQKNSLFNARCQSMTVLRNFYKSEDIFLDLFEDEYYEMSKAILNVEYLCMDSTLLLPPTGTPLTGIGFTRRLPCGEVEKARRAIRVFFLLRQMCQQLIGDRETLLPLTNSNTCVQIDNVLDLNNSDLIACTVLMKDGVKFRRFLVIDFLQLILVEPDAKRLGWGIAKLVGFLQDVDVIGDKEDSRCLHLTIHKNTSTNRSPILSAKFIFDDHIRCMAAKQRLTKGRSKARQKKMYQIAQLLEIPGQSNDGNQIYASSSGIRTSRSGGPREHRPLFSTANRVPGFAAALQRRELPSVNSGTRVQVMGIKTTDSNDSIQQKRRSSNNTTPTKSRDGSKSRSSRGSREGSPRSIPRPRSEEIPLEDFRRSRNSSPITRQLTNSPSSSSQKQHTSLRFTTDNSNNTLSSSLVNTNNTTKDIITPLPITQTILESPVSSEETSFISSEEKLRKKGGIETV